MATVRATSARVEALRAALVRHLGEKAGRRAAPIMLDMIMAGVVVVELHEIPSSLRDDGLLVRIAAELEVEATNAAEFGAFGHRDQIDHVRHPTTHSAESDE